MKTKIACLIVVLSLITTLSMAEDKITVQAQNSDISNNLDLKAVATVFGESRDLAEFEKKLNDYDSQISNLDLNNDGQVDYLRVIEKNENGIHVVVIEAVLAKDVFQDVASIIVEKDQNNNPTVQVVGDPYLYGENYVIEPAYIYTPSIFSFFWGPSYYYWNSPYYWGYYPAYYHHHSPYELNIYLSNVSVHVNHNQRYYYTNSVRNESARRMISSARRNDLGTRYPERSFSNRNVNVRNKLDFEYKRGGTSVQSRTSYQSARPVRTFNSNTVRNESYQSGTRSTNPSSNVRNENPQSGTRSTNPASNVRNSTYTMPTNVQSTNVDRGQNRVYQTSRSTSNSNVQQRTQTVNQPTQVNVQQRTQTVSQPAQVNVQRQQVVRQPSVSTPRQAPAQRSEPAKESRK